MRHKIDLCQIYLLSGTVTFQGYYAKTRRATCAWFCQRTSHIVLLIAFNVFNFHYYLQPVTVWFCLNHILSFLQITVFKPDDKKILHPDTNEICLQWFTPALEDYSREVAGSRKTSKNKVPKNPSDEAQEGEAVPTRGRRMSLGADRRASTAPGLEDGAITSERRGSLTSERRQSRLAEEDLAAAQRLEKRRATVIAEEEATPEEAEEASSGNIGKRVKHTIVLYAVAHNKEPDRHQCALMFIATDQLKDLHER